MLLLFSCNLTIEHSAVCQWLDSFPIPSGQLARVGSRAGIKFGTILLFFSVPDVATLILQVQKGSLQSEVGVWGEVERGFGRTGVQSFAIEGVLGELQVSFITALTLW